MIRHSLRSAVLQETNTRAARRAIQGMDSAKLKSFIVVTPHLIHMAPLATLNHGSGVQPVLVANGLSGDDLAWLGAMCPGVPTIELRTSLTGNPDSLLLHGVIIDYLAAACDQPFCIQDADCFVLDSSFWTGVSLDPKTEYATCVFVREGDAKRPPFPETFLTCLNAPLMRKFNRELSIRSESTDRPSSRAKDALASAGYGEGRVLETLKDYYDTLQQFWVIATHRGFRFRKLAGEGDTVHHIGGTSYLHSTFDDLAHWDYWPLAVHYFNMRLLELPAASRFRKRFEKLSAYHGSADQVLGKFPDFAAGYRRKTADTILDELGVADRYA